MPVGFGDEEAEGAQVQDECKDTEPEEVLQAVA